MIDKPSDKEEEFFLKQEVAKLRSRREKTARETEEKEKARLRELHWMRCPKCGLELAVVDFRGIEVDACFACGGMFLDRGEIDKLLEGQEEPGLLGRIASSLFGGR